MGLKGCIIIVLMFWCSSGLCDEFSHGHLSDYLASFGHRDIIINQSGDSLYISLWPLGYRDPYVGYGNAMAHIKEYVRTAQITSLKVISLNISQWGMLGVVGTEVLANPVSQPQFQELLTNAIFNQSTSAHFPVPRFNLLFDIPLTG